MQHRFFLKPEKAQKYFLINTGILIFLLSALVVAISLLTQFYLLISFVSVILLVAAPFIDLPMGKKSGKFIYHSPLFISEKPHNNQITIHGGTLFDYVFTIDKSMNAKQRTRFVLLGYVNGLLNFIADHEEENSGQDYLIRGTSYFVNDRTARHFGLRPVKTDSLQLIILLINYIPLSISGSYIKKRLHFPRFSEIKTYEGKLSEMKKHKPKLVQLKNRLEGAE